MKKIRNLMRDCIWSCTVLMYSIKNRILRSVFRIVVYLIVYPLIILLSCIMFIPMLIRYGKKAKDMDLKEQMEWVENKRNQFEGF